MAIIAGGAAYLYYRKSNLESPKKYIFPAIRFFSIFFILLLFFTPVLSFVTSDLNESRNIFLIDASRSLEIENRKNDELNYIKNKIPEKILSIISVTAY